LAKQLDKNRNLANAHLHAENIRAKSCERVKKK
jgi:hypothetical protein